MTQNPIKQDFSKHKDIPSEDNKVKYGLAKRCRDYAGRWAKEKFTLKNVLNAAVPNKRELVATPLEAIALGFALQNIKLFNDPLQHLKGVLYFGRHTTKTIIDAAQGGPEGMRAALKLEEAIEVLKQEAATNEEAARILNAYYVSKEGFVKELADVYRQNETFGRVCKRVRVQLEGMIKKGQDLGKSLKPEFMRHIDREIIINFVKLNRGWNPNYRDYEGLSDEEILEKAIRSDENLSEFYSNVLEFYNAREFNEDTVAEFCKYMLKTENLANGKNEKLEQAFPQIIALVKKGYSIEDIIFEMSDRKFQLSEEEVQNLGGKVGNYKKEGEQARATVQDAGVPIKDGPLNYNVIDIITHPFVIAAAAILAYKGLTRSLPLMGFADNQISKAVCLPLSAGAYVSKAIYNKSALYIKERRAKKQYEPKEVVQNEDTEGTAN